MDRKQFLGGAISGSAAVAAASAGRNECQAPQFVIVEMMGYKKLCGRMTQGMAGLLQLDIPVPGGFSTQYINPQSVYRITVVDEATVKAVAKSIDPLPTLELEVPARQTYLGFQEEDEESHYYGDRG